MQTMLLSQISTQQNILEATKLCPIIGMWCMLSEECTLYVWIQLPILNEYKERTLNWRWNEKKASMLFIHMTLFFMMIKKKNLPWSFVIISHLSFSFSLQNYKAFLSPSSLNIQRQRLHNSLNLFFIIWESVGQKSILKNDPGPLHVVGCNLFYLFV